MTTEASFLCLESSVADQKKYYSIVLRVKKVDLGKLQIDLSVSGTKKKKITAASGELGISFADEDVAVL